MLPSFILSVVGPVSLTFLASQHKSAASQNNGVILGLAAKPPEAPFPHRS